ncbi:SCO family protein [Legionella londiniensis]|uniref:SCO1/SenC family transporter protein n=1 Tax=Legionella londiniensis TaxID=45068 RepID=A0A0W0VLN4_9GAMM|nr:SCO family protein [Legionella londiniensis]KTD21042.1 SCO1/SenC family transporter protein [Legionella londiniensis]STX93683.1 SCO1/SenC family protein [Legionella londiniensis]
MVNKKHRMMITIAALLAVIALLSGIFVSQHTQSRHKIDLSKFHGTFLSKPRSVTHFELTGIDQQIFDNTSLNGKWTMLFFGFTNCGYLCPTTMAELGKMYRLLEKQGVKNLPNVVMVSIDPNRDSLEKLNSYVKAFDRHFYGVRGDEATIKAMTQELGVVYAKIALSESNMNDYDMEHTGTVMLFNPRGELTAFFTTPHQADLIAEDYMQLIS